MMFWVSFEFLFVSLQFFFARVKMLTTHAAVAVKVYQQKTLTQKGNKKMKISSKKTC